MLLVVTATPREAAPLVAALTDVSPTSIHGVAAGCGWLGPVEVTIATTGIGRAATSFVLSRLLLTEPVGVLQVGVGGAFVPSGLAVGDLALATTDTYADLGVRTDAGWIAAEELGFPLVESDGGPIFDTFPCHPAATEAVAAALDIRTGPFITTETVTGTAAVAGELHARHAPLIESMEGAAAAHACTLTGTSFVQLRGASNLVGPRDREAWRLDDAIDAAATAAARALPVIAEVLS